MIEHVIKQSNEAQNEVIRTLIRALRRGNWDVHASRLQEVLWTKQRVELALKNNKKLSAQRADFEILVDSIVQELCNETLGLVELQGKLSKVVNPELQRLKERIEETNERGCRAAGNGKAGYRKVDSSSDQRGHRQTQSRCAGGCSPRRNHRLENCLRASQQRTSGLVGFPTDA